MGYGQCVEQHGAGEPYMPVLDALGRIALAAGGASRALLRERAPTWAIQMPRWRGRTAEASAAGGRREREWMLASWSRR